MLGRERAETPRGRDPGTESRIVGQSNGGEALGERGFIPADARAKAKQGGQACGFLGVGGVSERSIECGIGGGNHRAADGLVALGSFGERAPKLALELGLSASHQDDHLAGRRSGLKADPVREQLGPHIERQRVVTDQLLQMGRRGCALVEQQHAPRVRDRDRIDPRIGVDQRTSERCGEPGQVFGLPERRQDAEQSSLLRGARGGHGVQSGANR